MKTIGYSDKCDGNRKIYIYTDTGTDKLNCWIKRNERIKNAFENLKHLGNVDLYLIKGNKTRLIATRGF